MERTTNSLDSFLEKHVGVLGRWQILLFIVVVIASEPPILLYTQLAFLTPPHHCAQPILAKHNWSSEAIKQATVPFNGKEFDSCTEYNISITSLLERNNISFDGKNDTMPVSPCKNGWTFDKDAANFEQSFTEEFQLVCQHRYILPLLSMAVIMGTTIGYPIGGYLGDRFGRGNTWAVFCLISLLLSCVTALSVSPLMFFFARFTVGTFISMAGVSGYVLCMEITNAKHRNTFNFFFHLFLDSLNASVVLIAYVTQNWRYYHVGASFFCILGLLRLCFVPESPRWLLCQGRVAAAERVLSSASRINGRRRMEGTLGPLTSSTQTKSEKPSKLAWYVIFTAPRMRRTTFSMAIVWISVALNYYGLSFFSVRLKGNPYVIASTTGLMGLPAGIVKLVLYRFFDRRKPLVCMILLSAFMCGIGVIAQLLVHSNHVVHVVLATIAIAFTATSFMMVYTLTPELYPTSNRNFATGFLTGISRVGAMASMVVERLDKWIWPALPMTIFCSIFLLSAVMVYILPKEAMEDEAFMSESHLEGEHETIL